MKATILTSVVALVFAVNVSANNGKTYTNVENEGTGVKKEYTTFKSDNSKPLSKTTYHYDSNGNVREKALSKWDTEKGWVEIQKYTYEYNETGQLATLAYTKWENKGNTRSEKSDVYVYNYDSNNEFISMNQK